MKIGDFENLLYVKNSEYPFADLNESVYILKLFSHLKNIMKEGFEEFEFNVYSNHDPKSIPTSEISSEERKKILIFISEEGGADPSYLSDRYFTVFKSYLHSDIFSVTNIFPFPLGCVREVPELPVKPMSERQYNVFFRGNFNSTRADLYRNLSRLKFFIPQKLFSFFCRQPSFRKLLLKKNDFTSFFSDSIVIFNAAFKSGYTPYEYGEIIADSKIVLCPKGVVSTECFRHYEAMRAGCVIISEKLPEVVFYKNSPIIQVKNWKEGLDIAKKLLKDEAQLNNIHNQTVKWWQEKCSEPATASYIYNCLKKMEQSI